MKKPQKKQRRSIYLTEGEGKILRKLARTWKCSLSNGVGMLLANHARTFGNSLAERKQELLKKVD